MLPLNARILSRKQSRKDRYYFYHNRNILYRRYRRTIIQASNNFVRLPVHQPTEPNEVTLWRKSTTLNEKYTSPPWCSALPHNELRPASLPPGPLFPYESINPFNSTLFFEKLEIWRFWYCPRIYFYRNRVEADRGLQMVPAEILKNSKTGKGSGLVFLLLWSSQ